MVCTGATKKWPPGKHLGVFPSRELALLVLKTYTVFCQTHEAKMKKKYPNKVASEIDSLVATKWENYRARGYTASSDESFSNDSSNDLSSRDGLLSGESSSENCYSAVSLAEEQTCSKDKKETKRKRATPLTEEEKVAKRRKRYRAKVIKIYSL